MESNLATSDETEDEYSLQPNHPSPKAICLKLLDIVGDIRMLTEALWLKTNGVNA